MNKRFVVLLAVFLLSVSLLTGCLGSTAYTCQDLTIEIPIDMQDLSEEKAYKDYTFFLQSANYCIRGERTAAEDMENAYLSGFGEQMLSQHGIAAELQSRSGQDYLYCVYTQEVDHVEYACVSAVYQADDSFWFLTIRYPAEGYAEDFAFSFLDTVSFS